MISETVKENAYVFGQLSELFLIARSKLYEPAIVAGIVTEIGLLVKVAFDTLLKLGKAFVVAVIEY